MPLGVTFSVLANKFLRKIKEKRNLAKFSAITLIIVHGSGCWVYVLYLSWMEFWGVLRGL